MRELGLDVETLEELLYVSSPLRARVSVDQIGQDGELGILEDSAHCGPSGHRHVGEYILSHWNLMIVPYACDCVWMCVNFEDEILLREEECVTP